VSQGKLTENEYLVPAKINSLRSKTSDISNASEPDSLLDLYKPPSNTATKPTSYASGAKGTRKASGQSNSKTRLLGEDASNWIHRDKLAQIESKELEEAGLRLGRRTSERLEANLKREEKRQRLASPVRMETEPEEEYDPSTPEEPSSTPPKSFLPKPNATRSGSSRIPVPRSVPGTGAESPAMGTRSRNGSLGWNNSADQSPQSIPSRQASHDDADDLVTASPPESPPRSNTSTQQVDKQSSPQKKSNGKTPRKPPAIRTTSNPKQRAAAPTPPTAATTAAVRQNVEVKRPGTSSGTPRPSTSHRPEGEPPWLATMYKPDPRLPPDQQMLPTHAKRLAQEQWEKEGKTGTVYDREFRLLNTEAFPDKPPVVETKEEPPAPSPLLGDDQIKSTILTPRKWTFGQTPPLGSPRSQASRPGTSDTHGGYKTMPTITMPATPTVQNSPANVAPIRIMDLPDDEEEKGKKGGCAGCGCIIM
jgi:hypothetical protein